MAAVPTTATTVLSNKGGQLSNRPVSWQSSDPAVATVGGTGATVTVTAVAAVAPTTITLTDPGATQAITTTPTAAPGATISYTNASSAPAVATVTATGANPIVTAVGAGTTTITINATGSGTGLASNSLARTVTVSVPAVATAQVSLVKAGLLPNDKTDATVTLRSANGAVLGKRQITWTSSNPAVATVSGAGAAATVTAVSPGTTTISPDTPNLKDGNWHHVAATYDGSKMRVFVDGLERLAVASATVLANPNDFKIGGRPSNTFLNGDLDEIRVSNVARTATEILARYCP